VSGEANCNICDGAGWDWRRAADQQLQVDDPVDHYRCPCVDVMRLRAAGDALAEVADEWPELVEAWQEARRER
jgi:hypothetical protein